MADKARRTNEMGRADAEESNLALDGVFSINPLHIRVQVCK